MKIQFIVEPILYEHENHQIRMRLLFESNINMHQTCIDKIFPIDGTIDKRKRLIDDMFYELRQRITENENSITKFLNSFKAESQKEG